MMEGGILFHSLGTRFSWSNSHIRHLSNCIKMLTKKCNKKSSPDSQKRLEQMTNCLIEEFNQAKQQFEAALLQQMTNKNSSQVYKYINYLRDVESIPHVCSSWKYLRNR